MTRRLAPKDVEGNVPIPHDLSGSNVLLYKIHGVFYVFLQEWFILIILFQFIEMLIPKFAQESAPDKDDEHGVT